MAAGSENSSAARDALESLCQTYWPAAYQFVLRREGNTELARDLTQSFFAFVLEKQSLVHADPQRGKFRTYLLTLLKNFLANQREFQQAQKRGGGVATFRLDFESSESKFNLEPYHEITPERVFERRWVLMLLDHVLTQLETEFKLSGKAEQFALFKPGLTGELTHEYYQQTSQQLGMTPEAAKQAAYRLRKRYGVLFRAEVARTLEDDSQVDHEIARLIEILAE